MRRYGWVPDLPDARDHLYAAAMPIAPLPTHVDLRPWCSPVEDQGPLGSCTGNAIVGALEYLRNKQHLPFYDFSRLFIYFNERVIEHTVASDSGAQIRDGIKSVAKLGCCKESLWPYDIKKFMAKPTTECYTDALRISPIQYLRVAGLNRTLSALAGGAPVVFGFTVYESFESALLAHTGVMKMPDIAAERVVGGHACLIVGYDQKKQRVLVRNSWGANWGIGGYFWMPFSIVADKRMSDDFWAITQEAA